VEGRVDGGVYSVWIGVGMGAVMSNDETGEMRKEK
jgi:hypothetical protein